MLSDNYLINALPYSHVYYLPEQANCKDTAPGLFRLRHVANTFIPILSNFFTKLFPNPLSQLANHTFVAARNAIFVKLDAHGIFKKNKYLVIHKRQKNSCI
jgi:hypothetical protein